MASHIPSTPAAHQRLDVSLPARGSLSASSENSAKPSKFLNKVDSGHPPIHPRHCSPPTVPSRTMNHYQSNKIHRWQNLTQLTQARKPYCGSAYNIFHQLSINELKNGLLDAGRSAFHALRNNS